MRARAEVTVALLLLAPLAALIGCNDDGAGSCPPEGLGVCDPIAQTCCQAGQHCVLTYGSGSFVDACLGGSGGAAEGEECLPAATSGEDACADGLTCLRVTGVDATSVCHALCRRDDDCAEGSCSQRLSGIEGIRACVAD